MQCSQIAPHENGSLVLYYLRLEDSNVLEVKTYTKRT